MIRIGSLFTGIAGLDRGVEQALAQLGQASRVEWQAEKDPYARAVLAKHYPTVRRYEDVRDVDAHAPPVDLICGGFPCQDLSLAGKREGITGARSGLWSEFERCIRVLRPSLVLVENVPELAAYLGHVLGPLAELGFDAEWGLFSAAEVGAPHRRERMFILAYARGYRFPDAQQPLAGFGEPATGSRNDGGAENVPNADGVRLAGGVAAEVAAIARHVLADADSERREACRHEGDSDDGAVRVGAERPRHIQTPPLPGGSARGRSSAHVGDAKGQRRDAARGDAGEERRPPTSDDAGRWWSAEPNVGRVVDGLSSRLDARRRRARLRGLGNGVVAEQAALAFVTLAQRAGLVGGGVWVERAEAVRHA